MRSNKKKTPIFTKMSVIFSKTVQKQKYLAIYCNRLEAGAGATVAAFYTEPEPHKIDAAPQHCTQHRKSCGLRGKWNRKQHYYVGAIADLVTLWVGSGSGYWCVGVRIRTLALKIQKNSG
jgi:hypothetical protein